jgi:hypothetical protein
MAAWRRLRQSASEVGGATGAGGGDWSRRWGGLRFSKRCDRFFDRQQLTGLHHFQESDFEVETGLQGELQIAEEIERELEIAGEVFFCERLGDAEHLRAFGRAGGDESGVLPGDFRDQQIAEVTG